MTATVDAAVGNADRIVTPDDFRRVFRGHPAGVAVVAFRDARRRPVGFTATSVISVSAEPPLLAFSVSSSSSSWPALERAATVTVSLLAADQAHVSTRFATSGIDRFAGGDWFPLPTGEPVIDGAVAWVRGHVVDRVSAGSSHLVLVQVLAHHIAGGAPLVFRDRRYHQLQEAMDG